MKSTTKSTRDEEMKHKKRGDKEKKHKHHKKDGSHKDRKRSGIEPGIDSLKKQPDKVFIWILFHFDLSIAFLGIVYVSFLSKPLAFSLRGLYWLFVSCFLVFHLFMFGTGWH